MFQIIKPGTDIKFSNYWRVAGIASGVAVTLSLLSMFVLDLNYGIDFVGGTDLQYRIDPPPGTPPPTSAEITDVVKGLGLPSPDVQSIGNAGNEYLIRLKRTVSDVSEEQVTQIKVNLLASLGAGKEGVVKKIAFAGEGGGRIDARFSEDVDQALLEAAIAAAGIKDAELIKRGRAGESREYIIKLTSLGARVRDALGVYGTVTLESSESVGQRVGTKMRNDTIKAVLFALIGILLYIGFRFDFRYGPGAVVALAHDAVLVLGLFMVVRMQFTLSSVAAILTIVGYSVNDTIVVYDRIRENQARLRDRRLESVINTSINETLSRTLLTSITTFLAILPVPFLTDGAIRDFAIALMFGILVGTYSSVFIASPLVKWLDKIIGQKSGTASAPKRTAKAKASSPADG